MASMSVLKTLRGFQRRATSLSTLAKDTIKKGLEVTISIHDITNLGHGVGRKELSDGSKWIIMVPLVIPGEEVVVRIGKNYSSYSEAELVRVIKPSPDRVTPKCPYFAVCGGCQYQHMSYDSQKKWKQSQVRTALERIGRIALPEVNPIVAPGEPYGYRSKLTPAYQEVETLTGKKDVKIGFKKRATHDVVDVDKCILASDLLNNAFAATRQSLKQEGSKKKKINSKEKNMLLRDSGEGAVEMNSNNPVSVTVNGIMFQQRAKDFFQNNMNAVPYLVNHVISHALGDDCHHLIDAYCGSGLFALCAASKFDTVHGVEISDYAVRAANRNADLNSIVNANFTTGKAEEIFKSLGNIDKSIPASNTVVVVDPPRAGCERSFLTQLIEFNPKKIVYVSCDPSTQARDARILIDAGGYTIRDVTPFDMFPQTRHVENVIVFVK